MNEIKVLLIEDNIQLREGIAAMLEKKVNITVKAAMGRKEKLDEEINEFKPHVILLNLGLRNQNCLQLVKRVTKKFPFAKMVVMDLSPTREDIIRFVGAGATGFILNDATPGEFINTIKVVAEGKVVLPELFTDLLLFQIIEHAVSKGEAAPQASVEITEFELKLLKLISDGFNNKDIAKKLKISPKMVETHIHNIKQNLSLFSLLELVNTISSESLPEDKEVEE